MARPTEYREDYPQRVYDYVGACTDSYDELGKLEVNIPSIEGLSAELRLHKDTIYEWCKVHDEFSDAITFLRAEQGKRLQNMGLSGKYNSKIAGLMLSANHGMREKTDVTTNDKEIKGIVINKEVEQALDDILDRKD